MQDPIYPTFTGDGQAPVVFDWPIATANSSAAFPNVNYPLIQSQMAQFFPNTAPPNVSQGITQSHTYAIGVFYKVRMGLGLSHGCMCQLFGTPRAHRWPASRCKTSASFANECPFLPTAVMRAPSARAIARWTPCRTASLHMPRALRVALIARP